MGNKVNRRLIMTLLYELGQEFNHELAGALGGGGVQVNPLSKFFSFSE